MTIPDPPTPGIYQHYKGRFYRVIGVGAHASDPETPLVFYQAIYGEQRLWVRELEEWLTTAFDINGREVQRFERV